MKQGQGTQDSDREATRQVKQLLQEYGLEKPRPFEQFKSDLKTPGGVGMVIVIGSFIYFTLVEHLAWWKAALLAWLTCVTFMIITAILINLKDRKKA